MGGYAAASTAVQIELREQAEVRKHEFSLGDIANINSTDLKLKSSISKTVIGRSPRVGYRGKFSRLSIRSRVEHALPGLGSRIKWIGADSVTVNALGVVYQKERYLKGAKKYLIGQLIDLFDLIQIMTYGVYRDLSLPEGEVTLMYQVKNAGQIGKRVAVWVDFLVDSKKIQSIPVWFKIEAYGTALTLKNDLSVGRLIRKDAFESSYRDLAGAKGTVVSALPKKLMRAKRRMKQGDILVGESIEAAPAVTRGSRVKVQASTESVALTVIATALQDGDIGDEVRIRRGTSGIKYSAIVTGRNTLSMDGGTQ